MLGTVASGPSRRDGGLFCHLDANGAPDVIRRPRTVIGSTRQDLVGPITPAGSCFHRCGTCTAHRRSPCCLSTLAMKLERARQPWCRLWPMGQPLHMILSQVPRATGDPIDWQEDDHQPARSGGSLDLLSHSQCPKAAAPPVRGAPSCCSCRRARPCHQSGAYTVRPGRGKVRLLRSPPRDAHDATGSCMRACAGAHRMPFRRAWKKGTPPCPNR